MIYFVRLGPNGPIKIGTTTDLRRRLKQLPKEYGVEVRVLGVRDGGFPEEREHHRRFRHLRVKRRGRGPCERFHPSPDLISYIERECRAPDLFDISAVRLDLPALERTHAVRLDLSTWHHKMLRLVAAMEGESMSSYARNLMIRLMDDEAKRRGIQL